MTRRPALPPALTAVLAAVSLIVAALTGLGYLLLDPASRSVYEQAIPTALGGWWLLAATLAAGIGWSTGRWRLASLGHSAICGVYLAFLAAAVLATVDGSDWRVVANRVILTAVQAVLAGATWRAR